MGMYVFTIQARYGEDTSGRRMASAKAQRAFLRMTPQILGVLISEVKIKLS